MTITYESAGGNIAGISATSDLGREYAATLVASGPNPFGICGCGCELFTFVSKRTERNREKGRHSRYLPRHHVPEARSKSDAPWLPEPGPLDTACWIWQRSKSDKGYGRAWHEGRLQQAHRVMYERYIGPIPEGCQLHHLCERSDCVNPHHGVPLTEPEHRELTKHLRAKRRAEAQAEVAA